VVNVNGADYTVVVRPEGTMAIAPAAAPQAASAAPAAPAVAAPSGGHVVEAPVAGTIIKYSVNEGASVSAGQTIMIIESMKMELEIKATGSGSIHFLVSTGTQVAAHQPVAELK
jgi:oxaloacetate decarboxylase alpha subunit